jgi:RNA polymerase sigma factor (sigma-70 family)
MSPKRLTGAQQTLFDANLRWAEGIGRSTKRKLPDSFSEDELVQAARIGLMKAVREFDAKRGVPFLGFAHVYVQSEPFMFARRREYTERTHGEIKHDPPGGKRPDEQVMEAERDERIHAAVDTLSPLQREVITQQFWFSASLSALSERLHVSQGELTNAKREALAQLVEALHD